MKLVLQKLDVRGPARMKYLAPDAAAAVRALERDTDGLVYLDMWRDPVAALMVRRTRKTNLLPGYSSHSWGMAVDIDVRAILEERKISYETLLYIMKKRGFYCHRRDGEESKPEAEHFNYLGDLGEKYLVKVFQDPVTWGRPVEERIFEKYGTEFQITLEGVQNLLIKAGFYTGEVTGQLDPYTRESILAFQRAWDLIQDGTASATLCRVLVHITAERELLPVAPLA